MKLPKEKKLTKVGMASLLLVIFVGLCYVSLASREETLPQNSGVQLDSAVPVLPRTKRVHDKKNGFFWQRGSSKGGYGFLESWLRRKGNEVECTLLPKTITKGVRWAQVFEALVPDKDSEFSLVTAWLKPEMPAAVPAPKVFPEMYRQRYTLNGRVKLGWMYFNQAYLGGKVISGAWTKEYVEDFVRRAKKREMFTYKRETEQVYDAVKKYQRYVRDKEGIVVGSETPWVEAILLENGAKNVLTLEFAEIESTHPQVETMIPKEFTEAFLNQEIKALDFGISFSSLEHDGLGRYGDVLNPEGDLQTMARMRSVIKPGGFFFLGVPVNNDQLVFNAHRFYGKLRIPKLIAGWKLIDVVGQTQQEVMVLQNLNGCKG